MKNKESKKEMEEELNQKNQELEDNGAESIENQKDEKDLQIEQLQKEALDFKDKFLRKAAEFENYKRRTDNDQMNLFKYAAESFITKLLPVVDDFERTLVHLESNSETPAKDIAAVKEGIKLVYDKFMKLLEEQGVTKINAIGKPFDVNFHEAVLQRKAEDAAPHTVLDELEKGYQYKDRVIRHSKVIVSEETTDETSSQDSENSSNNEDNK